MTIKASSSRTLPQQGGTQSLVLVGQRCGKANLTTLGSSKPYGSFHQRVVCPNGADAIQLVYPNFELSPAFATNKSETAMTPSMYKATAVVYSGGSGYAVGNIDTFALTGTTGITAVRVLITQVSSGVPTAYQILDGGLYNTPLSSGAAPASTTGSGTGVTATFTWSAGGIGMRVAIEPVFGTLVADQGGAGAIMPVSKGNALADTTLAASMLLPMGEFLVSDLIPVDVPVGGVIGIRTSLGYNTVGAPRPLISAGTSTVASPASYEAYNGATSFSDMSTSGAFAANTSLLMFTPTLILGIPKQASPTVMAVGDSRSAGCATGTGSYVFVSGATNYDLLDRDGNGGWFEKSLSGTLNQAFWPWSNLSMPADMLQWWLGGGNALQGCFGRLKAIGMAKPTAVYLGLNVNDITKGTSLASIKSWEQQVIGQLKGLGVKYVFTDTTDPYTSSSDSWATVANQTTSASSANILARNVALVSGTWASYDFYIDQRPNTESSVGSGKWAVNGSANWGTGDGVHASPALNTLKAATAAAAISANVSL